MQVLAEATNVIAGGECCNCSTATTPAWMSPTTCGDPLQDGEAVRSGDALRRDPGQSVGQQMKRQRPKYGMHLGTAFQWWTMCWITPPTTADRQHLGETLPRQADAAADLCDAARYGGQAAWCARAIEQASRKVGRRDASHPCDRCVDFTRQRALAKQSSRSGNCCIARQ